MSAFSADWLALREPADATARSLPLTRAIASVLEPHRELRVLDLGAGTGSNVRYLAERLPGRQHWLLVDHDDRLLAEAPQKTASWAATRGYGVTREANELLISGRLRPDSALRASSRSRRSASRQGGQGFGERFETRFECRLSTRQADLATSVDDATLCEGYQLVTASALLDLVSERWLRTLAERCAQSRACVLFALSYDGRIECSPADPEDETVRELVNRHQRTDKGFGAALGPDAAATAQACLARVGYDVRTEPSDWVVRPESRELQRQLIHGWAEAAHAIAPAQAKIIGGWRERRLAHVDAYRSQLIVGHIDLAAWPE